MRWAARERHFHIVKWICKKYNFTKTDIRMINNHAIRVAIENGDIKLVRWLCEKYQLTVKDIKSDHKHALYNSISNGYLKVIKYLNKRYNLGIIDYMITGEYGHISLRSIVYNDHFILENTPENEELLKLIVDKGYGDLTQISEDKDVGLYIGKEQCILTV